jgi:hypothetical protein
VSRFLLLALLASMSWAQVRVFPLSEVKPGLRGKGKTVFSGTQIEEFDVEILGVLENAGPKQSIILGKLSGGPLAESGVMQGMSGSPVYIDGRLVGAVALAFAFSKEPIAGIRPIEEMLETGQASNPPTRRAAVWPKHAGDLLPAGNTVEREAGRMIDIATPVSFGGFAARTIEQFAPQFRVLGLEPRQGVLGGGSPSGRTTAIEPGSMISVQLVSGDLQLGADGTVTHVEGNRVYAFGHRFLSVGATELPFARSEVLTLLPNLSTSFKISAAREWAGTITGDHNTAVTGELGRRARMVPVRMRVRGGREHSYQFNVVNDRFLTPLLLAISVHSGLEATERMVGVTTVRARADVKFEGGGTPIRIENVWAGEAGVAVMAAMGMASPLSYAMQSGFDQFRPAEVLVDLEVIDEKRQYQIDQAWVARRIVRPGDTIEVDAVLTGPGGKEVTRKATYPVPVGAPAGTLNITVADATVTNMSDYMHLLGQAPGSATEVTQFLNGLRPNDAAFVRIWRADPSYQVSGRVIANPPASMELILRKTQAVANGVGLGSKVAEMALDPVDGMVTGSKTIQVEIKE